MTLPVIGACLPVELLASYRDWLLEKQRDLELQSFHSADVLGGDWQPLVDEAKAQLEGFEGRLGIHGPFRGLPLNSPDPEIQAVAARRMDQALDVCGALGASQMVIHSPFTTWAYNNMPKDPDARGNMVEAVAATLGAAIARAESMGVTLVVENIEDINPEDRLWLIRQLGSPALKLSIDTGHAHYAHGSTGAAPVDYFVTSAGELLDHVHLQDADGYADRHWAIGEGTIRWAAVFAALARIEASPRLVLELRDKAQIPASMAWLAQHGLAQ